MTDHKKRAILKYLYHFDPKRGISGKAFILSWMLFYSSMAMAGINFSSPLSSIVANLIHELSRDSVDYEKIEHDFDVLCDTPLLRDRVYQKVTIILLAHKRGQKDIVDKEIDALVKNIDGLSSPITVNHTEVVELDGRPLVSTIMTCICVVSNNRMAHLITTIGMSTTKEEYLNWMLMPFAFDKDVEIIPGEDSEVIGQRVITPDDVKGYLKHRVGLDAKVYDKPLEKKFRTVWLDKDGVYINDSNVGAGMMASSTPVRREK